MVVENKTMTPAATLDGKGVPHVELEIGEITMSGIQKMKARVRVELHLQVRPDRWVQASIGPDIVKLIQDKLDGMKVD